jgi:hypothetical protein
VYIPIRRNESQPVRGLFGLDHVEGVFVAKIHDTGLAVRATCHAMALQNVVNGLIVHAIARTYF